MVFRFMFFLFILGLLIGSFLNVVAMRLPTSESFWRGRSHCWSCQKSLSWFELVPVVSFLGQGGKCRGCQKNIPWRYFLVEIITGGLFAGTYYFLSSQNLTHFWATLIFYLTIISVLEINFLIDLKDGVIFDLLIWPWVVLIFLFWFFSGADWLSYLLSGVGCASFFGAQYLLSRGRWVGAGDIGLGFLIGLFLGWPLILVALFFAYVGGSLFALFLILLRKKTLASVMPFAVFLVPATIATLFWGERLLNWYLGLMGKF